MKLLVVFGSESDHLCYEPLVSALSKKHQVDFILGSAYREFGKLQNDLVKYKNCQAILAGAGLAAHLPGMVASSVDCPVFGIPVERMFGGLDAFLSITQMPTGIPVPCTAPGAGLVVVDFIERFSHLIPEISRPSGLRVQICVNEYLLNYEYVLIEMKKAQEFAKRINIELEIVQKATEGRCSIILCNSSSDVQSDLTALHLPIFDKHHCDAPERVFEWLKMAKKGGLWLGVNNICNALLTYRKCADYFSAHPLEATHVHA